MNTRPSAIWSMGTLVVVFLPMERHRSLASAVGGKPPRGYSSSKGMLAADRARRMAWPRPVAA